MCVCVCELVWDSLDLGFRYLGVGWFKFGIRGREGRFNVRLRCKFCKTKVGKGQVGLGAVGLHGCMCGVFSCLHSESVSPASCLDVKEKKPSWYCGGMSTIKGQHSTLWKF